jgi:hypothetical protein
MGFVVRDAVRGIFGASASSRLHRGMVARWWTPVGSAAPWLCSGGGDEGTRERVAFQTVGGAWGARETADACSTELRADVVVVVVVVVFVLVRGQ